MSRTSTAPSAEQSVASWEDTRREKCGHLKIVLGSEGTKTQWKRRSGAEQPFSEIPQDNSLTDSFPRTHFEDTTALNYNVAE